MKEGMQCEVAHHGGIEVDLLDPITSIPRLQMIMLAQLDAMVLGPGECSYHEIGGHRTTGKVDAILDHGGPIVVVSQSSNFVLKLRSTG